MTASGVELYCVSVSRGMMSNKGCVNDSANTIGQLMMVKDKSRDRVAGFLMQ